MKCEAMFHSKLGPGRRLQTVGVMIKSPTGVSYHSPIRFKTVENEWKQKLSYLTDWSADSLWDYFFKSGNGITEDWSFPEPCHGATLEEVAAKMVARI